MADKYAVQCRDLCKAFEGREVLHRCSLNVETQTIYGLLGKNGAGKTTIFKLLLGLLQPTMGEYNVLGGKVTAGQAHLLKQIGSIIETPVFYEHLSAAENLEIHLAYMGIKNANVEAALKQVGLIGTGKQPVKTFSLGMRQRLAIARAIVHAPRLLILDEPLNGLDPVGIKEMRELFRTLVQEKEMTILISSHILTDIERMADRVGILAEGSILSEASMTEIRKEYPEGLEDYFMKVVGGGKADA